jgi:hypothetical protein
MGGANPTVYLGMPPLPIGGVKNSVATHIRGISVGDINLVAEPSRTTDIKGRTKGRGGRLNFVNNASKRRKSTGSNTTRVPKKAKKAKSNSAVRVLKKRKAQKRVNGRFVK